MRLLYLTLNLVFIKCLNECLRGLNVPVLWLISSDIQKDLDPMIRLLSYLLHIEADGKNKSKQWNSLFHFNVFFLFFFSNSSLNISNQCCCSR